MKNMKLIIAFLSLFVSYTGFSQKVKFDDNIVYVDGTEYGKYSGGGAFSDRFSMSSLDGEELVFAKVVNPGANAYYKLVFIGLDNKTAELSGSNALKKNIVKNLYNDKVIVDGKLDPKKVDIFISKYEENISGYKTVNNGTQTIIIKEEPRKSGVNINIGN